MSRPAGNSFLALLTAVVVLAFTGYSHAATTKAHSTHKKQQPKPRVDLPLPPPPTPEQMPAVAPQVSYQDGLLTIVAPNSTMSAVLNEVHQKTGANIEIPPGSGNERVVGRMGPGPARDVLATLLNGSRFNYVMIGSDTNPSAIQRIVLTSKAVPESETAANTPQPQPTPSMPGNMQMVRPGGVPPQMGMEGGGNVAPEEQEPPPPQPEEEQPQPEEQQQQQPEAQQNPGQPYPQPGQPVNGPNNPNQPQVKTPEQLLMELQRMQQQQQQQQQQQPQD